MSALAGPGARVGFLSRALPESTRCCLSLQWCADINTRNPIHLILNMTSLLQPDSQIRRSAECYMTEADGEIMMLHFASGQYIGMNAVASFIWKQLADPSDIARLSQAVQAEFAVDAATSADDTLAFVQRMLDDGLVEFVKE